MYEINQQNKKMHILLAQTRNRVENVATSQFYDFLVIKKRILKHTKVQLLVEQLPKYVVKQIVFRM